MAQQQNQSKLGSMKPSKIDGPIRTATGSIVKGNSIGAGWGGEKPMKNTMKKTVKSVAKKMPEKMAKIINPMKGKKAVKSPSKGSVLKSVRKTMGY